MKLIDHTGKPFGKLTVISYDGKEHWKCQCSCGNFISAYIQRLRQGRITSCGSIRCKLKTDIVGQRFGRLVVHDDFKYEKKSKWNRSYVKVTCDCGTEKYVMTIGLLGGDITSCGCYKREMQEEKIFKPYRISKGVDENIPMTKENTRYRSIFQAKGLKKAIIIRDKYTCKLCNVTYKYPELRVHHIVPISDDPAKLASKDNLITLCVPCHCIAHCYGKWRTVDKEIQAKLLKLV